MAASAGFLRFKCDLEFPGYYQMSVVCSPAVFLLETFDQPSSAFSNELPDVVFGELFAIHFSPN